MQAYKYPEMLDLIRGKLEPQKLIERTITLEDAIIELPKMGGFVHKGILVIDSF